MNSKISLSKDGAVCDSLATPSSNRRTGAGVWAGLAIGVCPGVLISLLNGLSTSAIIGADRVEIDVESDERVVEDGSG